MTWMPAAHELALTIAHALGCTTTDVSELHLHIPADGLPTCEIVRFVRREDELRTIDEVIEHYEFKVNRFEREVSRHLYPPVEPAP
jgi:hypothetical protein